MMRRPRNAGVPACTDAYFASENALELSSRDVSYAVGKRGVAGGDACVPGALSSLSIGVLFLLAVLNINSQTVTDAAWPQTESRLYALLSGNSEQKRTALFEIRNLQTERASRIAIPAFSDSDEIVRATAAASVVFLPGVEAANVLLPLLADKKPFVRREAAYALGKVRQASAIPKLAEVLKSDRDREVRSAAAVALGNIGDYQGIPGFLKTLRMKVSEDDEFLRRAAAHSIGQIFEVHAGVTNTLTPQNFLPPKFKDLGNGVEDVGEPLLPFNLNTVFTTLSQILQNPKEADDTRREAAFALGAIRRPDSAAILRSYLNSPDPYLAEIAKEALLKIEGRK